MTLSTMWLYVLGFMLSVQPPRSNDTRRLYEYSEIAWAIAKTDCTPLECLTLASLGHWESGYVASARGRLGEVGVFQVLPSSGPPTARNALHLLRTLTIDGYTGERANAKGSHPLARHREGAALKWLAEHPFHPFTPSPET